MKGNKAIKIALFGMDSKTLKLLTLFFNQHTKGFCQLVREPQAELVIIDADSINGARALERFVKAAKLPVIVLSIQDKEFRYAVRVVKPFQTRDLLQAIAKVKPMVQANRQRELEETIKRRKRFLRQEIKQALMEIQPRIRTFQAAEYTLSKYGRNGVFTSEGSYLVPLPEDEGFYKPNESLQGVLGKAIEESKTTGVDISIHGLGKEIVVINNGQYVFTKLTDKQLKSMAKLRFNASYIDSFIERGKQYMPTSKQVIVNKSDAMLWKISLWCSRGRLPAGTDVYRPIMLTEWPNLTRWISFPQAFQLAALWHKQALSIQATSMILPVSKYDIYTFYSACLALGLLRYADGEVKQLQAAKKQKYNMGILGKLLKRITKTINK